MRFCTVVRDSPSLRAMSAVEARASSRSTDSSSSSAGVIRISTDHTVESPEIPRYSAGSGLSNGGDPEIMWGFRDCVRPREAAMTTIDTLAPLRAHGKARTTGLDDATVLDFAGRDPQLGEAIAAAA